MAKDLEKYGVIPRKTSKEELTDLVPKELYRHYIRGIFDGDGTVYILNQSKLLRFGFYGSQKVVRQIHQYLLDTIGISDTKIFDKPTVSFSNYGKRKDILNFYHLMYDDSHIYLDRKKNKFLTFFQQKNIEYEK